MYESKSELTSIHFTMRSDILPEKKGDISLNPSRSDLVSLEFIHKVVLDPWISIVN